MPLAEQVLLSSEVLYGIADAAPENTPDTEDHPEDLKCILFHNELQHWLPVLFNVEAVYHAHLMSALSKIFIPPPQLLAA